MKALIAALAIAAVIAPSAPAGSGQDAAATPEARAYAATPVIRASARPARVAAGDTFTVEITARGLRNAGAVAFHLVFDPSLVAPVTGGFHEGRLLGRDGTGTSFLARPLSAGDRLAVGLTRLGASRGAHGSGTLCRLTFRALRSGAATFTFDRARLTDPSAAGMRARFAAARLVIASPPSDAAAGGSEP